MTVLFLGGGTLSFFTRHFSTRKAVQLYGLNWSESFQRQWANVGTAIGIVFIGALIVFLWAYQW